VPTRWASRKVAGPPAARPIRSWGIVTSDGPRSEAECRAIGGNFGRHGLRGDAVDGTCSPWVTDFGCMCIMNDGRAATICID